MKGIALITGINYAGKGTVLGILQDLWYKNHGPDSAQFASASRLMMDIAGYTSHHELGAMARGERDILRSQMSDYVIRESARKPFFLDMHFAFEDEERADFSSLIPVTRQIIEVRTNPLIILERRMQDPNVYTHPGRLFLTNPELIRAYQNNDRLAMEAFCDIYRQTTRQELPVVSIINDVRTGEELSGVVADRFKAIEGNFYMELGRKIEHIS